MYTIRWGSAIQPESTILLWESMIRVLWESGQEDKYNYF